jgi:hypothetical protein
MIEKVLSFHFRFHWICEIYSFMYLLYTMRWLTCLSLTRIKIPGRHKNIPHKGQRIMNIESTTQF